MIKKELEIIALEKIDLNDHTFQFTVDDKIDPLIKSIRHVGLINPIIVQPIDTISYRIVCGFKRVTALTSLKKDTVSAFVIEQPTSSLEIFLMAVLDNQSVNPLNPIELSKIIDKLQSVFQVDNSDIVKSYLPQLGFGRNPRVLQLFSDLHQLSKEWQTTIIEDHVSLDFAQDILTKSENEREKIWQLVRILRLGKNKQRDMIGLLNDVSQLKNQSLLQLLDSQPVQELISEDKLTPSQKAEKLKQWLWEKRYPRYSKTKSEYDATIRETKFPNNVFVQAPPYFEGEKFSAGFTFSSEQNFEESVQVLIKSLQNGTIKKLIDLT